jgi:hypothetical protein
MEDGGVAALASLLTRKISLRSTTARKRTTTITTTTTTENIQQTVRNIGIDSSTNRESHLRRPK